MPGTPKYLLLLDALGLDRPDVFAHLPLLVNEGRQKLSKRRDSVSVADFQAEGYLPEAMVNYLALLGWGPKDGVEVRPLSEIVELFRLEDVTSSPAFFDVKKLQSFNADHLRALPARRVRGPVPPVPHAGRGGGRSPGAARRAGAGAGPPAHRGGADDRLPPRRPGRDRRASRGTRPSCGARPPPRCSTRRSPRWTALDRWEADDHPRPRSRQPPCRPGFVNAEGAPQLSKAQGPVRVATTGRSVGAAALRGLEALGRERTLARLREARQRL